MVRRLVIDTDTGSDDAVALVLALRDPRVNVAAVTVVAGNVPVDMGVQNALYTRDLCGSTVPVHRGADRPLTRPLVTAHDVHGADGMGDVGLDLTGRQPAPGEASEVLVDLARRYPGELTLVTLGPLTNVARALQADPGVAALFDRVVVMGGTGDHSGNVSPVAEFNIWVDPEAADIVFRCGARLEMVGWDVSRNDATMSREDLARLAATGPLGRFCADIQRRLLEFCREVTRIDGIDLPDPVTMAVALEPEIAVRSSRRHVAVETHGELTRGMTVVDHLGITGQPPNALVVEAADRERFLRLLQSACEADAVASA